MKKGMVTILAVLIGVISFVLIWALTANPITSLIVGVVMVVVGWLVVNMAFKKKAEKETLKAKEQPLPQGEVRVKCNVCGHIYCYTAADIERNRQNYNYATLSAISAFANAVGGTMIGARLDSDRAEKSADKIVDYSRCPKCNSTDIHVLSKEEYAKEQKAISAGNSSVSSADELKKFKELLDSGVISQEEFDAKKKQLLGL